MFLNNLYEPKDPPKEPEKIEVFEGDYPCSNDYDVNRVEISGVFEETPKIMTDDSGDEKIVTASIISSYPVKINDDTYKQEVSKINVVFIGKLACTLIKHGWWFSQHKPVKITGRLRHSDVIVDSIITKSVHGVLTESSETL